jgi:hypothetical protein
LVGGALIKLHDVVSVSRPPLSVNSRINGKQVAVACQVYDCAPMREVLWRFTDHQGLGVLACKRREDASILRLVDWACERAHDECNLHALSGSLNRKALRTFDGTEWP